MLAELTIDKSPQSENLATLPYIKNTQPPGPTASTASEVIPTSEQQAFTRFFDSQELDTSAEPQNNFSDALGRLLPLNVQAIMLEFWIEKDGTTAQVKCLDGACSQAVIASLPELSSLRFAPAVRDGHAVASRKVLQIDPPPSFGL